MADIDRDHPVGDRPTHRERIQAAGGGAGLTGWWIGGVLIAALVIIAFFALGGADTSTTPVESETPALGQSAPTTPAQ